MTHIHTPLAIATVSALLALAASPAATAMGKNSKGGFGDEGSACADFRGGGDAILSDGRGTYCNGSDGQVSVPKRFRIDLKKFNANDRTVVIDLADCDVGQACDFDGLVVVQSRREYVGGQENSDVELDFQTIPEGETRFAGLTLDYQFNRKNAFTLAFGNDSASDNTHCPAGSPAGPVAVTCDLATDTGTCAAWTITGEHACLKNSFAGTVVDDDVDATFKISLTLQQP